MAREKKNLILIFAAVGFLIGVLASALSFFLESRGRQAGAVVAVIASVLCPAGWVMPEFLESGKALEVFYDFVFSVVNGCLYAVVGLLVARTMKAWHLSRQNRI